MPMLEKHILSTMVSLGTLAGLLGTVTGMIKAFSIICQIKLLLQMVFLRHNTATGISTSALTMAFLKLIL
jgi:biopolymer transport protein ExbB